MLSFATNCFMVLMAYAYDDFWTTMAVRCYNSAFSMLIVGVEFEYGWLIAHMPFVESWVVRGLCISFVGLMNMLFIDRDRPGDFGVWRQFVGYYLIGVGCVYTSLGLLCFNQLRQAAVTKIKRHKIMKEEVTHLTGTSPHSRAPPAGGAEPAVSHIRRGGAFAHPVLWPPSRRCWCSHA